MWRAPRRLLIWGAAVLVIAGVGAAAAKDAVDRRRQTRMHAARITGGNPDAGLEAIGRYGCGACHQIPGAPGARGQVGPSLKGVAARTYIAGRLNNTPGALVRWIRFPQQIEPGVVMPNLGVDEQSGRDIAAYLYTLK